MDDLQERVDILNSFRAEVFLSIHANNNPNISASQRRGIQVLYCATSDCPFPGGSKTMGTLALAQLGDKLAAIGYPVQRKALFSDLAADASSVPPRHIFLLGPANPPRHVRATSMPGVLAESLYLNSPVEANLLQRDSMRQG